MMMKQTLKQKIKQHRYKIYALIIGLIYIFLDQLNIVFWKGALFGFLLGEWIYNKENEIKNLDAIGLLRIKDKVNKKLDRLKR